MKNLKPLFIGFIPSITFGVLVALPISSFGNTIIFLTISVVLITAFYLWLLIGSDQYKSWTIIVGILLTFISGVIFGINLYSSGNIDIKYNLNLSKLCNQHYPNFQNSIINEDELKDMAKVSDHWLFSHVYAGNGNKKFPSAKKIGVECEPKKFIIWNGLKDGGERIPIVNIAGRTGVKLKWDIQEGNWCSFSIEASVLQGISYQRTFDLDQYKRISFDIYYPKHIFAQEFYIRLEDDAAIRNPDIHIPFSSDSVNLLKYLPRPDPNQWSTTPISLPLSLFRFDADSWKEDFDPDGIRTGIITSNEAKPDRNHIAQLTFVVVGESTGEIYLTNIRFDK